MKVGERRIATSVRWDNHFRTLENPSLERLLQKVNEFCGSMLSEETPHWLSLLGPPGIGKSHLARFICYFFVCKCARWLGSRCTIEEREARFYDWRKCADKLRNQEYDLIDGMDEKAFIVIDDIGTIDDKSGFIAAKLEDLCNRRMGKWTVITANLSLEQIADKIDTRLASRMIRDGNIAIQIDAQDFALRTIA